MYTMCWKFPFGVDLHHLAFRNIWFQTNVCGFFGYSLSLILRLKRYVGRLGDERSPSWYYGVHLMPFFTPLHTLAGHQSSL